MCDDNSSVDWSMIRAEYINGSGSLSDLAKKYGVSQGSIRRHSASERWSEIRKKNRIKQAEKVSEKLQNRNVDKTVKDIERCIRAAGRLIDKINKGISQIDKNYYISSDEKTVTVKTDEDPGTKSTITESKIMRKIKTNQYQGVVDTRKIADLSKSLLNIKQILTGDEGEKEDESGGVIEIPAMQELTMPEGVFENEVEVE